MNYKLICSSIALIFIFSIIPSKVFSEPTSPKSGHTEDNKKADDLLMNALGFLGISYKYGGSIPQKGLDCSGFIQYLFKQALNVNLPRTSAEQAKMGKPIKRDNLEPGDLLFFNTQGKRISHVSMYIGNGKMIHAPRTGKNIEIIDFENSKYWSSKYRFARRI